MVIVLVYVYNIYILCILVSQGCHSKLLPTEWLKTKYIYSPTDLESSVSRNMLSQKAIWENSSLSLPVFAFVFT